MLWIEDTYGYHHLVLTRKVELMLHHCRACSVTLTFILFREIVSPNNSRLSHRRLFRIMMSDITLIRKQIDYFDDIVRATECEP